MPFYDRICRTCGWVKADSFERVSESVLCPNGHDTERLWLQNGRSSTIIGDEWPGGKTFENLGDQPVTVYSRSELKREMDARGLESFVRHTPIPGSDKSPHTTSWDVASPYMLDEARKMLERMDADHAKRRTPVD